MSGGGCLLVDSHAHLNDQRLAPRLDDLLQAALNAGVTRVVNVGYDLPSSQLAVRQAEQHAMLSAAVGLHPHDAKSWDDRLAEAFVDLTAQEQVVAWGEIGLDYHYDLSPRELQQTAFHAQLELARSRQLPVIIHDRDAHGDVLSILRAHAPYPAGGVMHCYSGSPELVADCLRLGFYISFAGPLTFKNARKSVEAAAKVPLERLLVETDAPYLSPEPFRGRENHPAQVVLVAEKLASIHGLPYAQLAQLVSANAVRLFGLPADVASL